MDIPRPSGRGSQVAKLGGKPLNHTCFLVAVRHERHKYERALHLLDKKEEIKQARKVDKSYAEEEV